MKEATFIIDSIKKKDLKPVYLLMGEEPYFINQIVDAIDQYVLTEDEKDFNYQVLYGKDINVQTLIEGLSRYPMMSDYRVVIVKEAQELSRQLEKLQPHIENLLESTILVLTYKYKKLDKRKALYKSIKKVGVVFESKKLYENEVLSWVQKRLSDKGYTIDFKASSMLVEFLGTDLLKMDNELTKLSLILEKGATIKPEDIEKNIGISKDYNNFELKKALAEKNIVKANRIINYFSENQKNHPIVMTIALLYSFFTQLITYHGLKDKSSGNVSRALGINPYFIPEIASASKFYPMRKISQIIEVLRKTDLQGKGVGATNLSAKDNLKEMVFKILH